jgi:hypothetical protein
MTQPLAIVPSFRRGHWNRQCSFHGPAVRQAIQDRPGQESLAFGPVSRCQCYTLIRNIDIIPFVSSLFIRCCPANVSRRIGTIVLNPINRMLGRWFGSNLGQELLERSKQELDTTTTITGKVLSRRTFTPRLHRQVSSVFYSLQPTVAFSGHAAPPWDAPWVRMRANSARSERSGATLGALSVFHRRGEK